MEENRKDYYFIGEKLKYLRENHGHSKVKVAEHLDINMYRYNLAEDNVHSVHKNCIERIAELYQVPISYFIDDSYDPMDKDLKPLTHIIEKLSKNDHDELLEFARYLHHKGETNGEK